MTSVAPFEGDSAEVIAGDKWVRIEIVACSVHGLLRNDNRGNQGTLMALNRFELLTAELIDNRENRFCFAFGLGHDATMASAHEYGALYGVPVVDVSRMGTLQ